MHLHGLACLSFAAMVALAGCGGGAGSAAGEDTAGESARANRIAEGDLYFVGVATTGVLKNAAVTAYELDEFGRRLGGHLGTTETDRSGSYQLQLDSHAYTGGLIELEASVIEDRTTMSCDARRCGDVARLNDVPLPADFALSAIVDPPVPSNTLTTSITAWSTMAAERARAINSSDLSVPFRRAVKQANAEVTQIIGVDVIQTRPADISQLSGADAAQAHYAVMNAAAAEILYWQLKPEGLTNALTSFASALNDDGVLGKGSEDFTLVDMADAIRYVVNQTPELPEAANQALINQTAQFDLVSKTGFSPGYYPDFYLNKNASRGEKVAAFQQFVTQVRTWVSSIEELDTRALVRAVSIDSRTVETIVSGDVQSQLQFVADVVDQVMTFVITNGETVKQRLLFGGYEQIPIKDGKGRSVGSVRLNFWDDEGLQVALQGAIAGEADGSFLPFELNLETSLPVGELTAAEDAQDENAAIQRLAPLLAANPLDLGGSIAKGDSNPSIRFDDFSLRLELDPAIKARAGALGGERFIGLFVGVSMSGQVVIRNAGARFAGGIEAGIGRLGAGMPGLTSRESAPSWFERFRLAGEFSSADGLHSFSTSVMANVTSATAYDSFTWAEHSHDYRYVYGPLTGTGSLRALAGDEIQNAALAGLGLKASFRGKGPNQGEIRFIGYAGDEHSDDSYLECLDVIQSKFSEAVDLEQDCATSLLNLVSEEQTLSQPYLDKLEREVTERLAARFGGSVHFNSKMVLDRVFGYAIPGTDSGYYVAAVRVREPRVDKPVRDESFTISSKVDIPELRSSHVSATLNRTSYRGGSLRTYIKWEGGSYTADIVIDDVEAPKSANIRLFNAQGYDLNIGVALNRKGDVKELSGTATIDGEEVGYVTLRNGSIPLLVYPADHGEVIESLY